MFYRMLGLFSFFLFFPFYLFFLFLLLVTMHFNLPLPCVCVCVFLCGGLITMCIYVLYIYCIYNAGDYKLELYKSIRLEYKIYLYACVCIHCTLIPKWKPRNEN